MPVKRFHGIGPRGAERMKQLGIETGADLAAKDIHFLREHFGSQADYLYRAARGIDLRRVKADRARKSVGTERTFDHDISSGAVLREQLERIVVLSWDRIERSRAEGRTVTLKLKLKDFTGLTRARSLSQPVRDQNEFAEIGHALLDELLPLPQPVRLMGLTLSQLVEDEPDVPRQSGRRASFRCSDPVRQVSLQLLCQVRRQGIRGKEFGSHDLAPIALRHAARAAGDHMDAVDRAGQRLFDHRQLARVFQSAVGLFRQLAQGRQQGFLAAVDPATGQHPAPAAIGVTHQQNPSLAIKGQDPAAKQQWLPDPPPDQPHPVRLDQQHPVQRAGDQAKHVTG